MGQEVNWFPALQFSFDTNNYLALIGTSKESSCKNHGVFIQKTFFEYWIAE